MRFLIISVVALCSCGKKAESTTKKEDAGLSNVAPITMPALGVDAVRRFNFIYEAGSPAYDKAAVAYRKKDWNGVRAQAEASLARDPGHLGAHRLLAAALAQNGEPAAAVDHLVTALAADYYAYAPTLDDDDLKAFMGTQHGQAVQALAAKIRDEYAKRTAAGLWLIGRRSTFKWPKDAGVQTATSRGELYAFDRDSRRFFRLTHTDHQVAGFVRSGGEVAIVGYDKIDHPKEDDQPPLLVHPWIQVFDAATWKNVTPKIALPAAREVTLGYGAGDQLLVSTAQATGRWTVGEPTISSVDKATGKLTKVTAALPVPRLLLSLDEGHLIRVPDGLIVAWSGDPPTTASLKTTTGKLIQVPGSGAAAQSSIAVSPDGNHIAFATAADPCAKDAAPSLYVADAKTGTYKHILSEHSRFPTRWIDANQFAYEDGDGAIRVWDVTTGREAIHLEDKAGIALDVLSLAPAPLCKQAPPSVDISVGSGEEPLPPEEGSGSGSGGPVTAPNN